MVQTYHSNPFVTLGSMEENLNATANVKDKVFTRNHGSLDYGSYRGNINGDNLRREKNRTQTYRRRHRRQQRDADKYTPTLTP